ncbi:hypothetical protein T492DRAFT_544288 [Pavlovales sp. CCMP2436]|nr:hypothetical protein T492DRAFT_544288 [Pavlovales sp. CCMP2436]
MSRPLNRLFAAKQPNLHSWPFNPNFPPPFQTPTACVRPLRTTALLAPPYPTMAPLSPRTGPGLVNRASPRSAARGSAGSRCTTPPASQTCSPTSTTCSPLVWAADGRPRRRRQATAQRWAAGGPPPTPASSQGRWPAAAIPPSLLSSAANPVEAQSNYPAATNTTRRLRGTTPQCRLRWAWVCRCRSHLHTGTTTGKSCAPFANGDGGAPAAYASETTPYLAAMYAANPNLAAVYASSLQWGALAACGGNKSMAADRGAVTAITRLRRARQISRAAAHTGLCRAPNGRGQSGRVGGRAFRSVIK